jgi:hypothetical protein
MSDELVARLRKTTQSGRAHHLSKADRLRIADRIEADARRIRELEEALVWAAEAPTPVVDEMLGVPDEEIEAKYLAWSNAMPAHYNDTLGCALLARMGGSDGTQTD